MSFTFPDPRVTPVADEYDREMQRLRTGVALRAKQIETLEGEVAKLRREVEELRKAGRNASHSLAHWVCGMRRRRVTERKIPRAVDLSRIVRRLDDVFFRPRTIQ
jgi:uncharacterized protein YhaN